MALVVGIEETDLTPGAEVEVGAGIEGTEIVIKIIVRTTVPKIHMGEREEVDDPGIVAGRVEIMIEEGFGQDPDPGLDPCPDRHGQDHSPAIDFRVGIEIDATKGDPDLPVIAVAIILIDRQGGVEVGGKTALVQTGPEGVQVGQEALSGV